MRKVIFGADEFTIVSEVDVEPSLDVNKQLYNETDQGWSPTRELRRVAHIPNALIEKLLVEKGINVFNPAHRDALKRILNDPEWRYLRTAPGRV